MLAVAAIEKRCSKDIEEIRRVEREKAVGEVERVKRVFLDREAETAEDLRALEDLHADHCQKLVSSQERQDWWCICLTAKCYPQEREIEMYRRRLHDESSEREGARHAEARAEEEHRRSLEVQARTLEGQTRRAEETERAMREVRTTQRCLPHKSPSHMHTYNYCMCGVAGAR
jgi:hypothetical protein